MTTGSTSNNHHALHPRDDRETLSALFDGELAADAARFALRRLDHDAGWRDTCGRWQLIGDALRGQAVAAAPADFASGVMRALAAESQAAGVSAPDSTARTAVSAHGASRRRWLGGAALAASVAMAAVLVMRPFSDSAPATGPQVAAGMSAPAATTPQPPASSTGTEVAATSGAPAMTAGASVSATAVATAEAQPAVSRGAVRGARATSRPPRAVPTPAAGESATVVASAAPAAGHQPFHPPADDIVTRPWPRAALPGNASTGALTVDFETGTPSPSFYPFEPRLPAQDAAPAPQSPEPPR